MYTRLPKSDPDYDERWDGEFVNIYDTPDEIVLEAAEKMAIIQGDPKLRREWRQRQARLYMVLQRGILERAEK